MKRYFWLSSQSGALIACRSMTELREVEARLIRIGWNVMQCDGYAAYKRARSAGFKSVGDMVREGGGYVYKGWAM